MRILKYFVFIIALVSSAFAAEPSDFAKLSIVKDQYTQARPCHELKVRYQESFPSWIVGARDRATGTKLQDQVTSSQYKNARFDPLYLQSFEAGKKRYYKPAYYFDFTVKEQAEFVGFLSFKVAQVVERYTPSKHDKWNPVYMPEWVPGEAFAKPIKFRKTIAMRGIPPKNNYYVVYEVCYDPNVHLPYDSKQAGYRNAFPDFPFENFDRNGKSYMYGENDVPTFYGFYNQLIEKDRGKIENYTSAITAMVIVRDTSFSLLPIVGTAISIKNCYYNSEPDCWAGAGLDAISDAAMFLKLAKVQKLVHVLTKTKSASEAAALSAKFNRYADKTLYMAAYGNTTLGALYLARGEVLEGAVRLGSGGIDIFAAHINVDGLYGGKVGKSPEKCPTGELEVKITEIKSDAPQVHYINYRSEKEIPEAPNAITKDEFMQFYYDSLYTNPGEFQYPTVQKVRRLDSWSIPKIINAHGRYPNPEYRSAESLAEHMQDTTSTFVSATYADNVRHLVRNGYFFPYKNMLNYTTMAEMDDLYKLVSEVKGVPLSTIRLFPDKYGIHWSGGRVSFTDMKWPPGKPLPPPVKYETWEYEAITLGTKNTPGQMSSSEMEVITRAMRIDEMTRARRIVLELEFKVSPMDGNLFLSHPGTMSDANIQEQAWEDIKTVFYESQ